MRNLNQQNKKVVIRKNKLFYLLLFPLYWKVQELFLNSWKKKLAKF